jgi:hypothetical protein
MEDFSIPYKSTKERLPASLATFKGLILAHNTAKGRKSAAKATSESSDVKETENAYCLIFRGTKESKYCKVHLVDMPE